MANDEFIFSTSDMRWFSHKYRFCSIYCFFTSFGYYTEHENMDVLLCISRSLFPEGKFLLHVRNRDWFIRNFVSNQWDSYHNHTELTKRRFDLLTSRLETEIEYWPSGKKVTQSIRFYTLAELAQMFEKAGINIIQTYGDIDCSPYTIDSEWCVIVGEKK